MIFREIADKFGKRAGNFEKKLELGGLAMICLHQF
jgi:hypothetical protein